jgi:hypothetical protein
VTVYVPDGLGGLKAVIPGGGAPGPLPSVDPVTVDAVYEFVARSARRPVFPRVSPYSPGLMVSVTTARHERDWRPLRESGIPTDDLLPEVHYVYVRDAAGREHDAGTIVIT